MRSSIILPVLLSASVLAFPGHRDAQHQHHRRAPDVTVYHTIMVTEWHTETAGQAPATIATTAITATPAGNVAVYPTTTAAPYTTSPTTSKAATTLLTSAVAAAATSPATTATTASSNTGSTGSKRGLAWPSANAASFATPFLTSSSPLSWYFNWGTGSTGGLSSLQHVVQQWGPDNLNNLASIPAGSVLLGFNEPDHAGQASMSPAQAAAIYKSTLTPLRKSGKVSYLGSPGVTNGGAGLPWLTEFMSLCSDCEIDFIAAHWYGPSMTLLQTQLTAIHAAFNKPVWLTEFACTNWVPATNPSASEVGSFMTSALAWLEATPWIEKYAWFGALQITDASLGAANMLITSDGTALSALGKQYMA